MKRLLGHFRDVVARKILSHDQYNYALLVSLVEQAGLDPTDVIIVKQSYGLGGGHVLQFANNHRAIRFKYGPMPVGSGVFTEENYIKLTVLDNHTSLQDASAIRGSYASGSTKEYFNAKNQSPVIANFHAIAKLPPIQINTALDDLREF